MYDRKVTSGLTHGDIPHFLRILRHWIDAWRGHRPENSKKMRNVPVHSIVRAPREAARGGFAMGGTKRGECGCEGGGDGGGGCCCECSCCGGGSGAGGFTRRFQTRAEQTAEMERYLRDLKDEVQAVEERLADLKGKKR